MKPSWQFRSSTVGLMAFVACLLSTAVLARDLGPSDPDRHAILDAARLSPSDKFVVKDLIKDQGYAYLCGLIQGPSGLKHMDGKIAVYQFILHKDAGQWVSINMAESGDTTGQGLAIGTTDSASRVDCRIDGHSPEGAEIRSIWQGGN